MPRYYDDLSADSSPECSSAESEDDAEAFSLSKYVRPGAQEAEDRRVRRVIANDPSSRNRRFILHMDVDCFYCQCECLYRKIPFDRPLAIGQKHIVVTCNYAAREVGVTKLQLREDAIRACPHLLIVEGSDLERYRIYARQIYQSLRRACKALHPDVRVAKGSMDEASVDLTAAVLDAERSGREAPSLLGSDNKSSIFVYSDQSMMDLRESSGRRTCADPERLNTVNGLHIAAKLALRVRNSILQETGFTTTFGVSSNPLLSKIASGLRKPGTVNVLLPWCGVDVLRSMPLRGIPGIGSRTVRALRPCLEESLPGRPSDHKWTCGELSQVPLRSIEVALRGVGSFSKAAPELARTILAKCNGVDDATVQDDSGRPPQVVSVENSFRRGSLLSRACIEKGMVDLFRRLPRLLQDRWASFPPDCPRTIRLTIRYVPNHPRDGNHVSWHGGRSNSITTSEQSPINGKQLLEASTLQGMTSLIESSIEPILRSLLDRIDLNVTRINLCLADFRAVTAVSPPVQGKSFFQHHAKSEQRESPDHRSSFGRNSDHSIPSSSCFDPRTSPSPGHPGNSSTSAALGKRTVSSRLSFESIDPKVLEELPPDIAREIRNAVEGTNQKHKKQRTKTLDQFFARRPGSKKSV